MISDGKMQQAFATPNTDDPYLLVIAPIHDTKRRVDEFPQKGLIEFGRHPSHIGIIGEGLDTLEDRRHQPCPDIGHPLLRVPDPYLFQIAERGARIRRN